jgi:uncharacterized protein (TIGR00369 family)
MAEAENATESTRRRTVSWEDPAASREAGAVMSGIGYLQAIRDGRLPTPPIAALMGFQLAEVAEGHVVFECEPAEYHYNPIGSVHGGVAATLLDSAMGCAVNTVLPVGTSYTTLELKVNYLRPLQEGMGTVRAEGRVITLGSRVAVAEGRLTDERGKLCAFATTTCLVLRP